MCKGLVGSIVKGLAKVLLRDPCLELEDEGKVIEDYRPLLAGMILLLQQTIANDQAIQANARNANKGPELMGAPES